LIQSWSLGSRLIGTRLTSCSDWLAATMTIQNGSTTMTRPRNIAK
jgi:hypothetical protein